MQDLGIFKDLYPKMVGFLGVHVGPRALASRAFIIRTSQRAPLHLN